LHFVRKNTQLQSPFINYQIKNHQNFEPLIAFRKTYEKENEGGFAKLDLNKYKYLDLGQDETKWEKIIFKTIRILSKRQVSNILDFIKREKIDICHFHYGTDCGVFYPLLKQLKIPSVVSFYGYDCFSFPKKLWGFGKKYLNGRVFKEISRVLTMSPEMKTDLLKIGCPEEKILFHYHGIPSEAFFFRNRNYDRGKKVFELLSVSYLDPVKGHLFSFKALQKIVIAGNSNIRLKIIGKGFYKQVLKKYIKENGLNDYVVFLGSVSSAHLLAELENADGFIHPSVITKNDKEGIPGAIVEAMFSGLPVIATYHGGIPYIIENNKTGILVKEWDIAALSDAIVKLSQNPKLREELGTAGQKYALAELNLLEREKELERIYDSLIN